MEGKVMNRNVLLACDGPLNGEFITAEQAKKHNYVVENWPVMHDKDLGEEVYMWVNPSQTTG
jgi:hypothetical protein